MERLIDAQNSVISSPQPSALPSDTVMEHKTMMVLSSNTDNNKNERIRSFDCAICCESLEKPGPHLECFTFGKLLIDVSQLPYLEREHIYREFALVDQCFTNGQFDCNKVVATRCGHMFHSGCIREWFFIKRLERDPKCPLCNSYTTYDECRILHPLSCNIFYDEKDLDIPVTLNETEYSDISCTSSSWATDDDDMDSSASETDDALAFNVQEGTLMAAAEESSNQQPHLSQDENNTIPVSIDHDEGDHTDETGEIVPLSLLTDDSTLYHADYIPSTELEKKPDTYKRMLKYIEEFDLLHVFTMINLIIAVRKIFKVKKERFLHDIEVFIENADDEDIIDVGYKSPTPLGYEFVFLGVFVGLFILGTQSLLNICKQRGDEGIAARVGMMTYACALVLYGFLSIYTTHIESM